MATDTAKFKGRKLDHPEYNPVEENRKLDQLKHDITVLFPELSDEKNDEPFDSDRERFVAEIINEVHRTKLELIFMQAETTKGETRAELKDLLRTAHNKEEGINNLINKIPEISPALDRLLDADFDAVECIDQLKINENHLQKLIGIFEAAAPRLEALPKSQKTQDKQHDIVCDLINKVMSVMDDFGLVATQYASADHGKSSDTVKMLTAIGGCLGHNLSEITWRDIIGKCKNRIVS